MIDAEEQVATTGDLLIETASLLNEIIPPDIMETVSLYARLYARAQVERVAMNEHRAGRHTLAAGLLSQA